MGQAFLSAILNFIPVIKRPALHPSETTEMSAPPPEKIRALKQEQVFEVQWPGQDPVRLPFRFVRQRCPCASCIDEFTGARILNPDSVPTDIAPTQMGFRGNYALQIGWSDGHGSGLYTWDHLADLAAAIRTTP